MPHLLKYKSEGNGYRLTPKVLHFLNDDLETNTDRQLNSDFFPVDEMILVLFLLIFLLSEE